MVEPGHIDRVGYDKGTSETARFHPIRKPFEHAIAEMENRRPLEFDW